MRILSKLKLVGYLVILLLGASMNAQSADGSDNVAQGDASGASIRLVDNKGTIKYLQSNNGITAITSTESGNLTTTTWQLGGTLVEDTDITTGANEFKLTLNDGTDQGTFVIDGIEEETGGAAADGTTIGTSGWTLLIRDEATGQVKNMLATELINGVRVEYTQSADATADVDITVSGMPTLNAATTAAKLFVYRNGAKLRYGTDFSVTADTVTITYSTDVPMYSGDEIEIQYVK